MNLFSAISTKYKQLTNTSSERLTIILLIFVTLILASIPLLIEASAAWGYWKGVPSTSEFTDSNLYYSRMREIADGQYSIGNPYFFEHRNEIPPAFLLADWISALPLLTGFSMTGTIIFNFYFWSIINTLLIFLLLRTYGVERRWSFVGTIFSFCVIYLFILRPTSLQIIYPFYTLLLISIARFIREPARRINQALLIGSFVFACYLYTYLLQIAGIFWIILAIVAWLKRSQLDRNRRYFIWVSGFIALLNIPLIIFTLIQIRHPWYWETMARIGLVNTHLPTFDAFKYAVIIAAMILLWLGLYLRLRPTQDREPCHIFLSIVLMGGALLLVGISNIITGKELETAPHITRFTMLWLSVALCTFLYYCYLYRKQFSVLSTWKRTTAVILILFVAFNLINNARGGGILSLLNIDARQEHIYIRNLQEVAGPLAWLERNESQPVVVWTPPSSSINDYLTILTKHYVLFSNPGILSLVPDNEVEERFLLANSDKTITLEMLKNSLAAYAGVGPIHISNTSKRFNKLCRILPLVKNCGLLYRDAVAYKGEQYFSRLFQEYNEQIKPRQLEILKEYQVRYILTDAELETTELPSTLKTNLIYSDSRFTIYKID
jgi:hypothetical protein